MNHSFPPIKRIILIILFLSLVFIVGGLGGVYFDRELLPRLLTSPRLAHLEILRKAAENITIINRTEEVVIREDDAIERVVAQPSTAVVNIVLAGEELRQFSGVLITNDGLIVTYAPDLPEEAEAEATILLFDGTSAQSKFVGTDTLTGLSYFRIEGINTPSIAFANSSDSRVGRKLIVIGNSAGEYQNRLAVGILGNKNRTFNLAGKTVSSTERWEGVFEMDVPQAIEFVGGPAVGMNGEMVGIIGMVKVDQMERFFLLPSNTVRESLSRILANGSTSRPYFGAYYLPITKALAITNDLSRDRGALIYSPSGRTGLSLIAGSPAERAGLRYGDIIIAVNGEEVNLDQPLSVLIGRYKKDESIELLVLRGSDELTVPVTLK